LDTQRLSRDSESSEAVVIVDVRELSSLCGFTEIAEFQQAHHHWVADSLTDERMAREVQWSEAVAVGNLNFVQTGASRTDF
jgi:hypothetical protein